MAETLVERFWLELREPGCVPERKGPWPQTRTADVLREFMAARPYAYITVVTVHDGEPLFQDGAECLQMTDGRSMITGRKHIASSNAAHATPAVTEEMVQRAATALAKSLGFGGAFIEHTNAARRALVAAFDPEMTNG